jgi:hypothetical protein
MNRPGVEARVLADRDASITVGYTHSHFRHRSIANGRGTIAISQRACIRDGSHQTRLLQFLRRDQFGDLAIVVVETDGAQNAE